MVHFLDGQILRWYGDDGTFIKFVYAGSIQPIYINCGFAGLRHGLCLDPAGTGLDLGEKVFTPQAG